MLVHFGTCWYIFTTLVRAVPQRAVGRFLDIPAKIGRCRVAAGLHITGPGRLQEARRQAVSPGSDQAARSLAGGFGPCGLFGSFGIFGSFDQLPR